ncbi:TetR/AcrR family transcriptional regulator [Acinetobacter shaoyimingii]|uniref:TetR/AcrR family transcriptional regulator n=1 Tax=Acinetobacter shaoyimingii TaxID=2715164 RepID=A0A6G8RVW7_9GAMM|nr:TetR/AcrR family transcriptional regulator [Acinetobacter shaoyimingii]QIO06027.1 TetR/AcrR family transcriptional regulator [Acinetobacter shaoyimingii]
MLNELDQCKATVCDIPQTRRGQERRLALLLSATTLFLERGYDAVSLDDVVQHAGGSKASIYKYFGSKEGLFTAICDYRRNLFFQDICSTYLNESENLRTYLITTLFNFYNHLRKAENIAFLRLIIEQTQRSTELASYIHEQGPKQIQSAIANALENANKNGLLCCENPLYSAKLYFGILRDLEWRILMNIPITESDQEITNYVSYCVDRFLDGHQKR